MSDVKTGNLWDIFCRVIDNYGDIGVCWRLATGLTARGERVRLWVDDDHALSWMAPEGAPGVEVKPWVQSTQTRHLLPGDILVEAFGCEIPDQFIALYANNIKTSGQNSFWINLEYLSAQGYAERCHGLPSPVMSGPGAGLTKHFFYPGFTAATGGLLREPDLLARQARFDRAAWLRQQGIEFQGERLVSLFCYEPPTLEVLLEQLASDTQHTRLLVTTGRAAAAINACVEKKNRLQPRWNQHQKLSLFELPALTHKEFDHLLWACDLNFVRGEDSMVRALWANRPFVWQIYPQDDDAHHAKLEAFLNMLHAPHSLRVFHHLWNAMQDHPACKPTILPWSALTSWQQVATQTRDQLLAQDDLVSQVLRLASKNL